VRKSLSVIHQIFPIQNNQFSKEVQMVYKYMKKDSTSLSHKGNTNQKIIEIPFHLRQIGYYQENKEQSADKEREKGTLYTLLVEMQISAATMEIHIGYLKKAKDRTII
jgi:hypothetical protein